MKDFTSMERKDSKWTEERIVTHTGIRFPTIKMKADKTVTSKNEIRKTNKNRKSEKSNEIADFTHI